MADFIGRRYYFNGFIFFVNIAKKPSLCAIVVRVSFLEGVLANYSHSKPQYKDPPLFCVPRVFCGEILNWIEYLDMN